MPDPRWDRLKRLFAEAEELSSDGREAFLRERCADDDALRGELEELLAARRTSIGDGAARDTAPTRDPLLGTRVDAYEPIRVLGEGGFGTVYLALQRTPVRRTVALKVLLPGRDSRQVVARFEQERQALALMDHPGIARVYDAGVTPSGRPYVVMEHVDGPPLDEYCDRERLDLRARLTLFARVCAAVQHAHSKGVIHRDLKPGNVLVAVVDERPWPKVIDFGVAKATGGPLVEATLLTELHQIVGTLSYMSPEQARADAGAVDMRSDVYCLGVLLYELLTGRLPHDRETLAGADLVTVLHRLCEVDAERPSARAGETSSEATARAERRGLDPRALASALRGDLDCIVMRCLDRDPDRRYQSALDLARDVERHLAGEPVEATSPSLAYRIAKFARRHRALVAACGAVALALALGTWGTLAGLARARGRDAERLAKTEEAAWSAYRANLLAAQMAAEAGDFPEMRGVLAGCEDRLRGWEWRYLSNVAHSVLARLPGEVGGFFPERELLWTRASGAALVWDLRGRRACPPLTLGRDPNERITLTLAPEGEQWLFVQGPCARLFDLSGRPVGAEMVHDAPIRGSSFRPDGETLLTYSEDRTARLWSKRGEPLGTVMHHTAGVLAARFGPDERTVVTIANDGEVATWDPSGARRGPPYRHDAEIERARFTADGSRLLTIGKDESARLWDTEGGAVDAALLHRQEVEDASFSPDSLLVLTWTGQDVHVWTRDGEPVGSPLHHAEPVKGARFSPDGRQILTSTGHGAHLWDREGRPLVEELWQPYCTCAEVGHDGAIWTVSYGGYHQDAMQAWEPAGALLTDRIRASDPEFLEGGPLVLSGLGYGTTECELWDARERWVPDRTIDAVDEDLGALELAGALEGGDARPADFGPTLDADEARVRIGGLAPDAVVVVLPDGSRAITAGGDRTVRFWETATWREVTSARFDAGVTDLRVSADGTRLAVVLEDGSARVWDTREPSARRADLRREFAERDAAERVVEELYAGDVPTEELLAALAPDATAVERWVAAQALERRLTRLEGAVVATFAALIEDEIDPAAVHAAALDLHLERREEERVLERVAAWSPDQWHLRRFVWRRVRRPGAPRAEVLRAVDAARRGDRDAWSEGHTQRMLGVALLRAGASTEAVAELERARWTNFEGGHPGLQDLAYLALAQRAARQEDAADATFEELRALVEAEDGLDEDDRTAWEEAAAAFAE